MHRLRLISFNIHGGRSRDGKRDLGRVHALLDRFDVDIGVFQEMETRPSRRGSAGDVETLAGAGRPYRFRGASLFEDGGWYGNLIVSRRPILSGRIHDLETRPQLEPRNAVDVTVDSVFGPLRVVGTHLSLSPFERRAEARKLLELMDAVEEEEENPLLLMGDINEWQRPSRLLRFLDAAMVPVPCKPTFPAWLPLLKLDRVWHDAPALRVTAHRLADAQVAMLSDHLPLLIEITHPEQDGITV